MTVPRVLTVAGSDCSGGAGIEADLKTFTVHGCYGMTCITGLTAQNTLGVNQIVTIQDPSFINKCLTAVFSDIGVDAVKTGMLACSETVRAVAEYFSSHKVPNIVVDPVMVSTSGANLIGPDAIQDYISHLIPLATVLTPNVIEARFILEKCNNARETGSNAPKLDTALDCLEHLRSLAAELHKLGPETVLVKGGHLPLDLNTIQDLDPYQLPFKVDSASWLTSRTTPTNVVVDVLYDGQTYHYFTHEQVPTKNTHGTGCTLAASIASHLAANCSIVDAVSRATDFVYEAIRDPICLGQGNGPINHLHPVNPRPFIQGKFVEYVVAHPSVAPYWHEYIHHDFANKLGDGTLDPTSFRYFLIQDYVYLQHYMRAISVGGAKAGNSMSQVTHAARSISNIEKELDIHLAYCKEYGISAVELASAKESLHCYAYTRWLMDVAHSSDWVTLQVALFPCFLGYIEVARRLARNGLADDNRYKRWVEGYVAPLMQQALADASQLIEEAVTGASVAQIEQFIEIFATATKMECAFWSSALNL